jgi:hypothetical protein
MDISDNNILQNNTNNQGILKERIENYIENIDDDVERLANIFYQKMLVSKVFNSFKILIQAGKISNRISQPG